MIHLIVYRVGGVVGMAEIDTTTNQRVVQAFAKRNGLSLDDAEKMLLNVHRWDDLPEGYIEDEEQKWAGLLESLRQHSLTRLEIL